MFATGVVVAEAIKAKEELAKERPSVFGNTNGDLKRGLEFGYDEYKQIDLTLFPKTYTKYNNIKKKDVIEIYGRVEKRFDKYQIIVNDLKVLQN